MRDWTPLLPPHPSATNALTTALRLIEQATGRTTQWNERQSSLIAPLNEQFRLALHVPKLTWMVLDSRDRKKARLAAHDQTLTQGAQWLTESLHKLEQPTLAALPPSDHTVTAVDAEQLEHLTAWLASAHQVLTLLAGTDTAWSSAQAHSTPPRLAVTHHHNKITLALELTGPHRGEPAFTVTQGQRDVGSLTSLVCGEWSPAHQGAVLSASHLDNEGQREQIVSFIADALAQLEA